MEYRRALVTGGAGFIGSHLVERLLSEGLQVVVLDDLSVGKRKNVPAGAEFVLGDVRDPDAVATAISDVDVVFHLAARVSIRASIAGFYEDAETNLMGTLNVLRACAAHGIKKFVYASSMAVYADAPHPVPLPEPYSTYGPRQTFTPYVGVITIFIQRLLRGEPPVIFGDGEQCRDFVYVGDVVEATFCAMLSDVHGEVFNIGSGTSTSVNQIASLLCSRLRPDIVPRYAPEHPGELRNSIADISKARRLLGYEPQGRLEEKIDEVIAWNREMT